MSHKLKNRKFHLYVRLLYCECSQTWAQDFQRGGGLCLQRCSKPDWIRSWATCPTCPCFGQRVGLADLQTVRFSLNYSVIQSPDTQHSGTWLGLSDHFLFHFLFPVYTLWHFLLLYWTFKLQMFLFPLHRVEQPRAQGLKAFPKIKHSQSTTAAAYHIHTKTTLTICVCVSVFLQVKSWSWHFVISRREMLL